MRDSAQTLSDREFRTALLEALRSRSEPARGPPSEEFLWIASALLLGANLLLILAVFLNFIGGLGPVNPSTTVWLAFGMDLVGTALLGWVFWGSARGVERRSRLLRRFASSLLIAWVGLTATWRFAVPAALGTNVQALFTTFLTAQGSLPAEIGGNIETMYALFGLWIAAAAVFVAAHVVLAVERHLAGKDDWVRGLPVYAWILAAGISLAATAFIVLSFLYVLAGRALADNFNAWVVAKVIVAPNVFLSGYTSSLQLGRAVHAGRRRPGSTIEGRV